MRGHRTITEVLRNEIFTDVVRMQPRTCRSTRPLHVLTPPIITNERGLSLYIIHLVRSKVEIGINTQILNSLHFMCTIHVFKKSENLDY